MTIHPNAAIARKAFTLIELLIVVAIIAILAAIAVPNFLEAQVRAKVSRAQADMRSLATALEAYRVDNTKYPPGVVDNVLAPAYAPANLRKTVAALVSTPIAYMTSYPEDAFKGDYRGDNPASDPLQLRRLYDYRLTRFGPVTSGSGNTLFQSATGSGIGVGQSFDSWLLYSPGPDREQNINTKRAGKNTVNVGGFGDPFSTWAIYDPTNGTVSWGDIIRTREAGTQSLVGR
ncbi:prepilin-type N-terminal cleavage/methylation domain-containing protein [bacterium]|nr:prepilin-type N-terminal cleavage/methylation domain-containing protein [bacterium]